MTNKKMIHLLMVLGVIIMLLSLFHFVIDPYLYSKKIHYDKIKCRNECRVNNPVTEETMFCALDIIQACYQGCELAIYGGG